MTSISLDEDDSANIAAALACGWVRPFIEREAKLVCVFRFCNSVGDSGRMFLVQLIAGQIERTRETILSELRGWYAFLRNVNSRRSGLQKRLMNRDSYVASRTGLKGEIAHWVIKVAALGESPRECRLAGLFSRRVA